MAIRSEDVSIARDFLDLGFWRLSWLSFLNMFSSRKYLTGDQVYNCVMDRHKENKIQNGDNLYTSDAVELFDVLLERCFFGWGACLADRLSGEQLLSLVDKVLKAEYTNDATAAKATGLVEQLQQDSKLMRKIILVQDKGDVKRNVFGDVAYGKLCAKLGVKPDSVSTSTSDHEKGKGRVQFEGVDDTTTGKNGAPPAGKGATAKVGG